MKKDVKSNEIIINRNFKYLISKKYKIDYL
jgi:hypothetical protein